MQYMVHVRAVSRAEERTTRVGCHFIRCTAVTICCIYVDTAWIPIRDALQICVGCTFGKLAQHPTRRKIRETYENSNTISAITDQD